MPVPITNQSPLGHHGRLSESKVFAGGHLVGEDHIIDLSVGGGHLVVKAGVSQGLLASAAGERCLPPHKCVLDHQEGGVDLQSIQSHTLLFNHYHLEKTENGHIFDLLPSWFSNLKEDAVNFHCNANECVGTVPTFLMGHNVLSSLRFIFLWS